MAVKQYTFLTVNVPSYSRQEDSVSNHEIECEVVQDGKKIRLVPRDARPTQPYLVEFDFDDLRDLAFPGSKPGLFDGFREALANRGGPPDPGWEEVCPHHVPCVICPSPQYRRKSNG